MKRFACFCIVLLIAGCGTGTRSARKEGPPPSAFEVTIRGEQLETPKEHRIDPNLLSRYRTAITQNANELIIRTDPGNDIFHVTDVEIESVFLGKPSIIGARVTGKVDDKYRKWYLIHPEGRNAEFLADYVFTPEGQYQKVRNASLVRVYP
jgi:hypothetical protein